MSVSPITGMKQSEVTITERIFGMLDGFEDGYEKSLKIETKKFPSLMPFSLGCAAGCAINYLAKRQIDPITTIFLGINMAHLAYPFAFGAMGAVDGFIHPEQYR